MLRSRLPEAFSALNEFALKMDQVYQDKRYYDCNEAKALFNKARSVDPTASPQTSFFNLSCKVDTSGALPAYELSASGKPGLITDGIAYSIDQTGFRASVLNATRWGTFNTNTAPLDKADKGCWVAKSNKECSTGGMQTPAGP
ncbi:MAG: hypothetical protein FWD77_02435 [Betaproteobacteria bacterium]|nr:hypothetical protein [Betaproteobacteria bacterium]